MAAKAYSLLDVARHSSKPGAVQKNRRTASYKRGGDPRARQPSNGSRFALFGLCLAIIIVISRCSHSTPVGEQATVVTNLAGSDHAVAAPEFVQDSLAPAHSTYVNSDTKAQETRQMDFPSTADTYRLNPGRLPKPIVQGLECGSKVLGHADYKSTMRYSHLANETLLSAVEAGASRLSAQWG